MKLFHLLQTYEFDETVLVINDMFPGTNKFCPQLKMAYDILLTVKPVNNDKTIHYKVILDDKFDHFYVGVEDSCFNATWEVCLGKDISRGQGVDLNDAELLADALVNFCLQAKCPKEFEPAHQKLIRGQGATGACAEPSFNQREQTPNPPSDAYRVLHLNPTYK